MLRTLVLRNLKFKQVIVYLNIPFPPQRHTHLYYTDKLHYSVFRNTVFSDKHTNPYKYCGENPACIW